MGRSPAGAHFLFGDRLKTLPRLCPWSNNNAGANSGWWWRTKEGERRARQNLSTNSHTELYERLTCTFLFFLRRSTAGVANIRQEIAAPEVDLRFKLVDVTMTVWNRPPHDPRTTGLPQVVSRFPLGGKTCCAFDHSTVRRSYKRKTQDRQTQRDGRYVTLRDDVCLYSLGAITGNCVT